MKEITFKRGTIAKLNAYNMDMDAYIVTEDGTTWELGDIGAKGDLSGRKQISLRIGPSVGNWTKERLAALIAE